MLALVVVVLGALFLWGAVDVIVGVFQMAWGLGILLAALLRWIFR